MEHEILLDVRHLTHIFPLSRKTAVKAVDDVSFQIRRGEIFGLVGESGSGKSTAARCVMNIYQPYAGQIYYKGIDTCDRGQFRKNKKMLQTTRQMIFQDSGSSLNQKMKVRDIIEEPMRVQKIRPLRGSYEEEARFQMKYVGLDPEYLKKYPGELSGGQRQRVAFARALAPRPQVLLLDEPFAAIDAKVRSELRLWLRSVVTKLGITSIFVTHDQDEAVEVADEIIITNHGTIEQIGTPAEIYNTPDTPFVAQFIGRSSLVEHYEELHGFDKIEGAAKAVIRPEFVKIHKFGKIDRYMSASQDGIVKDIVFRGNRLDVTVDVGGIEIICEWPLEKESLEIGEKVSLLIYRLYVLDKERTYLCENKEMQEDDVFYI